MNNDMRERTYVSNLYYALDDSHAPLGSATVGRPIRPDAGTVAGTAIRTVLGRTSRLLVLPLRHAVGAFAAGLADKAKATASVPATTTEGIAGGQGDEHRDEPTHRLHRIDPADVTLTPAALRDGAHAGRPHDGSRTHGDTHAAKARHDAAPGTTDATDANIDDDRIGFIKVGYVPAFETCPMDGRAVDPDDVTLIPACLRDAAPAGRTHAGSKHAGSTRVVCRTPTGLVFDKLELKALVDLMEAIEDGYVPTT